MTFPSPLSRELSRFKQHDLGEGWLLLEEASLSPRPERTGAQGKHWWLLEEENPVAYGKTVFWPEEEDPLQLSDIEVHGFYRGRSLARRLTGAIAQVEGQPVFSTGNWTEEGARALHFLPLARGYEPGVYYRKQAFVAEWESLTPIYR